jgi:nitrite reductase/ring-hydroxylating ferredoxin subunit
MDLPECVAALGERLERPGAIVPDPQLLTAADVFASERDRLFMRPWIAVDHVGRLDETGHYFRFDAATRSILVTRTADGRLHALRNVCIHAGYPVCDAEEGAGTRLVCPYHGWEFALDGRLLEPDLSARIDPARLRLASHPVSVRDGLIFVDLSQTVAADGATAEAVETASVPQWLADAEIVQRTRYSVAWNWKFALQLLKSSPHLVLDEPDDGADAVFGPLSLMMVQPRQAALLRVIPKSAERTDIQLIRMAPRDSLASSAPDGVDRLAEALREAGDAAAVTRSTELDRPFFTWYWSLMSAN